MTSSGMTSVPAPPGFMSAVLTFILPGAIVSLSMMRTRGYPKAVVVCQGRVRGARSGARDGRPCKADRDRRRGDHGYSHGPARWLDLVRRRAQTLEGRQDPRADARTALCKYGVRGTARLWWRSVQVARAHQPADQFGQAARFHDPVFGG